MIGDSGLLFLATLYIKFSYNLTEPVNFIVLEYIGNGRGFYWQF